MYFYILVIDADDAHHCVAKIANCACSELKEDNNTTVLVSFCVN